MSVYTHTGMRLAVSSHVPTNERALIGINAAVLSSYVMRCRPTMLCIVVDRDLYIYTLSYVKGQRSCSFVNVLVMCAFGACVHSLLLQCNRRSNSVATHELNIAYQQRVHTNSYSSRATAVTTGVCSV
jgi:hypothetical protein